MFDVITFGTATRDAFLFSKEEFDIEKDKHAPTGKVIALPLEAKIELKNIAFTSGGGATNAAVTFARQGLKAACVCKIGNDPGGKAMIEELRAEGADASFVQEDHNLPTGYSIILDVGKQGRTVLVYRGAAECISKSDVPFPKLLSKWFYITSLGAKDLDLLKSILHAAEIRGIKVAIDPHSSLVKMGSKKLAPFLDKFDVFKCNLEEASYLTGIDYRKQDKIFKKMDELVKGLVVITDGPNGVSASDGKTLWKAGIFKEKRFVDRTGAGDAFGSGFVAAIARGLSVPEGIRIGTANATSVVEYIGAKEGILTAKDLKDKRWSRFPIHTSKS